MTDNAWSYRHGNRLRELLAEHPPFASEWAYRQVFTTNDERTAGFTPWLPQVQR